MTTAYSKIPLKVATHFMGWLTQHVSLIHYTSVSVSVAFVSHKSHDNKPQTD